MSSRHSRQENTRLEKLHRKAAKETPTLSFEFGVGLMFHGPIISTTLTITDEHKAVLGKAGLPIPDPVICRFLIDTGADLCMVKHEFAQAAGLKLINANSPIHGVGIDSTGKTYMGRIAFACNSRVSPGVLHQFAIDTQILSGELMGALLGAKLDGLIGRNVLQSFDMNYNGMTGKVEMKFIAHTTAKRLPPGTKL